MIWSVTTSRATTTTLTITTTTATTTTTTNNVNNNYCFPKDFLAQPMNTKAVWLSKICLPKLPVVTHKNCAGQYNIIAHPYHCYWVTDWSKITPIFFVLIQYPWELNFWCGTSSPPLKLSPGKARPTVAVTVVSWSLSLDKFKTNSILLAGRFWGGRSSSSFCDMGKTKSTFSLET